MLFIESAIELHDELNPIIFDESNKLRPLVRKSLLRVISKYIESSEIISMSDVIDAELVGSNASYNYTPYSDLDVHLVVNMEAVSCDPALFQLACNAERSNFNKNYDITIKGIEIEMYVEDVKASTASNGIYSLYKDEWIKFPQKITVPNYDSDEEYIALLDKWKSLAETVLGSANEAQQVQDYINNLYNLRRTSIMTDGEFGKGNLVFKEIRNLGLLDKLKEKQYELSSKELSLESMTESNVINMFRGIDKNLEKFDDGVDWWTVSEEDAYDYGPGMSDNPDQAAVLKTQLDLSKYRIPQIKDKDINSIYTNSDLLRLLNLDLLKKDRNEIVFIDDKQNHITIKNDLDELQPFINNKLKKLGYDGLFAEFMIGTKPTTEIAIFNDSILNYDHPDWYKRNLQQSTEGINMNKKRYRVNYLLGESYHYSYVESFDETEAEDIVIDYLKNPSNYVSLGTEEDKAHLLEPGNNSAMTEIINKLIIDEWEAISGYNSASVTAQQMGLVDAAELLSDLSKEEIEHVGELQELLKSFDKNTHAIADGEEEAKDKLDESIYSLMEATKDGPFFKDFEAVDIDSAFNNYYNKYDIDISKVEPFKEALRDTLREVENMRLDEYNNPVPDTFIIDFPLGPNKNKISLQLSKERYYGKDAYFSTLRTYTNVRNMSILVGNSFKPGFRKQENPTYIRAGNLADLKIWTANELIWSAAAATTYGNQFKRTPKEDAQHESYNNLFESINDLDEIEYAKLVTIVDKKYKTTVDKFIQDVMQGKQDRNIEYVVSEPNNSIEFADKDMSNGSDKVIYRYFIDEDNGEILVYVNVK